MLSLPTSISVGTDQRLGDIVAGGQVEHALVDGKNTDVRPSVGVHRQSHVVRRAHFGLVERQRHL